MSIEAMKQALAALETCRIRSVSEWSVEDVTPKNIKAAIESLRTAIQQAESVPVAMWIDLRDGDIVQLGDRLLSGGKTWRTIDLESELIGREYHAKQWWPMQRAYTHPAPGAPDDVVRDAISTVREQYRGTDWGKAAECICDAIDAALGNAMLAAKDVSA